MAQNPVNTPTSLNGIFKTIYNDKLQNAIPEFSILQKMSPFAKAHMVGDNFQTTVLLSTELGFSYGGQTASAFAINASVSLQTQPCIVRPSEIVLQSQISTGAIKRAENTKGAVEGTLEVVTEAMLSSCRKRVELAMLYGQSGIGKIASGSGTAGNRVYTVTAASWAPGTYSGVENAGLDVYTAAGSKINTLAPVVITAVNPTTRALTVTGNATDLTAVDAAIAGGTNLFWYASYALEMVGIDQIITNTGVLFGIDASVYSLWKGNVYDCLSAPLTMAKVLSGMNLAVGRGLMKDVTLFVSPDSYANLNNQSAGQRLFDDSYKSSKAENGFESIDFHGSNGTIKVVPHAFCKQGDAFAFNVDDLMRVGSTDIVFQSNGTDATSGDQEYLTLSATQSAYALRIYSDQSIFHLAPSQTLKFINIVAS